MTELAIPARYNGPPNSGNGGYCCGRFAQALDSDPLQALQVTLRRPPPLDTPLQALSNNRGAEILHGEQRVAEVSYAELAFDVLPAPSPTTAKHAETRFRGFENHPFASCFVCGPDRHAGDGLRLFPGAVETRVEAGDPVACHWQPYTALCDDEGNIRPEFIWAALDCPTFFGAYAEATSPPTAVLGRQALRCLRTPLDGKQAYIIQSWLLDQSGRKRHSAGAMYTEAGECVALCRATWVELSQ